MPLFLGLSETSKAVCKGTSCKYIQKEELAHEQANHIPNAGVSHDYSLLATAVPAPAAPASTCTYTIEADKTSANPGDAITFTVYMQQTGTQNSMEGTLVVPEGLSFVEDSGKLEDGIATTLNWTGAGEGVWWTPW